MAKSSTNISIFAVLALAAIALYLERYRSLVPRLRADENHTFATHILSTEPLILHLENFVTPEERAYLVKLGEPKYAHSGVLEAGITTLNTSWRTSTTAFLSKRDPIVKRIGQRASSLQGYYTTRHIDVQLTRYRTGQYFKPHHDSYEDLRAHKTNRRWTIFVTLVATCDKCGTGFPDLYTDWSDTSLFTKESRICELVDCEEPVLTTLSKEGNALLWENMDKEHNVFWSTTHQGLPVPNGTKIGMNIWTSEPLSEREQEIKRMQERRLGPVEDAQF